MIEYATKKRKAKGADWIVANDVSPQTGIMGGDRNTVHLVTAEASKPGPTCPRRKSRGASLPAPPSGSLTIPP